MKRKKKKRKLKKGVKLSLLFSSFLLFFLIGFFFYQDLHTSRHHYFENPESTPTIVPHVEESSFSLVMVGDALIHEAVYADAKTNQGYDFKPMLEPIKDFISTYDVAYYNQETILGGEEIGLSHYPRFNSPYSVGDAFIDAGFNLVSLSTNHTLDRGEQAILNSRSYWNQHPDILAAGSYASFEERNKPVIKEVNGITYTMLSCTDTTNGLTIPSGKEYLLNKYDPEQVKKDIELVRDKVDVLLVSMHWGTEYSFGISERQKEIATYLASLNVDLIIGTHPHVVEPIEFIDDTMVIYSLGNVISAQRGVEKLTGGVVTVEFKKKTIDDISTITLENPQASLFYTYSKGSSTTGRYDFKVYPYWDLNDSLLKNYNTYYQKYISILLGTSGKVKELEKTN